MSNMGVISEFMSKMPAVQKEKERRGSGMVCA
jgi:hypothetical protein